MGDDGAHAKLNQIGSVTPLDHGTIIRAQVTVANIALTKSESPGEAKMACSEVLGALGIRARLN